jgi:hypothetical protein
MFCPENIEHGQWLPDVVLTMYMHVYLHLCLKLHAVDIETPTYTSYTHIHQHMRNQKCHRFLGIIQFFKQVTITPPTTQASYQKRKKPLTPWCYSAPATPPKEALSRPNSFVNELEPVDYRYQNQASVYLQKVLARAPPTRWHRTSVIWHCAENLEVWL